MPGPQSHDRPDDSASKIARPRLGDSSYYTFARKVEQVDAMAGTPIKVGGIAEQTGPLSFMGIADANVAKMVIDDINANGGLLGRQLALCLEDGATTDSVAMAVAEELIEHDRVDVLFGGIYSSTRQAIKGPVKKNGALHLS